MNKRVSSDSKTLRGSNRKEYISGEGNPRWLSSLSVEQRAYGHAQGTCECSGIKSLERDTVKISVEPEAQVGMTMQGTKTAVVKILRFLELQARLHAWLSK